MEGGRTDSIQWVIMGEKALLPGVPTAGKSALIRGHRCPPQGAAGRSSGREGRLTAPSGNGMRLARTPGKVSRCARQRGPKKRSASHGQIDNRQVDGADCLRLSPSPSRRRGRVGPEIERHHQRKRRSRILGRLAGKLLGGSRRILRRLPRRKRPLCALPVLGILGSPLRIQQSGLERNEIQLTHPGRPAVGSVRGSEKPVVRSPLLLGPIFVRAGGRPHVSLPGAVRSYRAGPTERILRVALANLHPSVERHQCQPLRAHPVFGCHRVLCEPPGVTGLLRDPAWNHFRGNPAPTRQLPADCRGFLPAVRQERRDGPRQLGEGPHGGDR